ncbi:MAG: hypothetical protein R3E51_10440 [Rhizobiaceae bacterium]
MQHGIGDAVQQFALILGDVDRVDGDRLRCRAIAKPSFASESSAATSEK